MNKLRSVQKSRTRLSAACFLALQAGMPLYLAPPVMAQSPADAGASQTWWQKLRQADSRITACRVSWKRIRHNKPNPQADPEKWAARTLDWARQQGYTEAEAQRQAAGERRWAQRSIKGETITTLLDFVRIGKSVRCNMTNSEWGSRSTEFSDGKNSLYVATQVKGKELSKDGNLTSDQKDVLRLSAGGDQMAHFLLGLPLQEQFGASNPAFAPDNTTITEQPGGNLLLERKFDPAPTETGFPSLLTIDKEQGRPIAYKVFSVEFLFFQKSGQYSRKQGSELLENVHVEGYRQYRDGVWFPSKVTVDTPTSTTEYTLVKAAFNEDVDPMELRLPAGMRVADARFGYGSKLAIYKLKDGQIPSDEEVRKMLRLDKEATQAKDEASKANNSQAKQLSSLPLAPAAGLMFIGLGSVMWAGAGRKKSNEV